MKDEQGRTTIAGFYDSVPPLTPEERRILKAVPDDETALLRLFGVAKPDAVGESLQEAIQFPSLNVRGMRSGYTGADARTIIPSDAVAAIDIRLVKETPGRSAVRRRCWRTSASRAGTSWKTSRTTPPACATRNCCACSAVDATEAYRTEMDQPEAARLTRAIARAWGERPGPHPHHGRHGARSPSSSASWDSRPWPCPS